jgi:hypothetical protein
MSNGNVGERKVYKDDAVRAMDAFLGGTGGMSLARALQYARGILDDTSQSLANLTAAAVDRREGVLDLNSRQAEHFGSHWTEAEQEEMRRGYREAVRLATEDQLLPIETFWVTGPNEKFEIFAEKGPRQVTVVVFIPPDVEERAREGWEPSGSAS